MCKFIQKMKACPQCQKLAGFYCCKIRLLETWGASITNLVIRFYMGLLFWKSADAKVTGEGLFGLPEKLTVWGYDVPLIPMPYQITETTYMLFEYEYQVPYISANFATISSTFAEIFLSLMLMFGFAGRFAALGLLVMTLVIHFTYEAHATHYVWMMLLAVVLTAGPGKISIDCVIRNKMKALFCSKD